MLAKVVEPRTLSSGPADPCVISEASEGFSHGPVLQSCTGPNYEERAYPVLSVALGHPPLGIN